MGEEGEGKGRARGEERPRGRERGGGREGGGRERGGEGRGERGEGREKWRGERGGAEIAAVLFEYRYRVSTLLPYSRQSADSPSSNKHVGVREVVVE